MQEIKEGPFDFSKMEEEVEGESLAGVLAAQQQVLSTDFAASEDNRVPPDGAMEGALEGDNHCEVDREEYGARVGGGGGSPASRHVGGAMAARELGQ
jgi:hypothetical protein